MTQIRPTPRGKREREAYLTGYGAALDHVTEHPLERVRAWHQMVLDADARLAERQRQSEGIE